MWFHKNIRSILSLISMFYMGMVILLLFYVPIPEGNAKVTYFFLGSVFGVCIGGMWGYYFNMSHESGNNSSELKVTTTNMNDKEEEGQP